MAEQKRMAEVVTDRLATAARALGVRNPGDYVGGLLQRTFWLPEGDAKYAANALTPGAAPCEPEFAEEEPNVLRFTIEPLGPGIAPVSRRDEATREMRRLVGHNFGGDALRWFDERSEDWRGFGVPPGLDFGAWFGTAVDRQGLNSSTVFYELHPRQINALPAQLAALVRTAIEAMPALVPVFTTISCSRHEGSQRANFVHRGLLRLARLEPLMARLGLAHQLPGVMQVAGLTLGGRFDLPERAVVISLRQTHEGPEMELEILLGAIPDVPPTFMDLLALGLSERPQQVRGLSRWLRAFTPEEHRRPGDISVLSIRATPRTSARVSLYLRPIEFEIRHRQLAEAG